MKNQFFYTRKDITGGTPEAPEFKTYTDSFNVEKVIRSLSIEDGRTLVLLDDLHELTKEVPEINPKTNKVTRLKKAILQSRKKLKTPGHKSASNTSFETIQEEDLLTENEEGLIVLQEEPIERPKEYVNVFGDLN